MVRPAVESPGARPPRASQATPRGSARRYTTDLRLRSRLAVLATFGCLASTGCNSQLPLKLERKGPVGVLVGEVRLSQGARLPRYSPLDLVRRPLRLNSHAPLPTECRDQNVAAETPVTLTSEGRLRGVIVAASDFARFRPRKPKVHRLVIEHCRLQPSTIAAMNGDSLALENRDAYAFEPMLGPTYEARALAQGQKVNMPLVGAGVDSIQCSLGAPCGRADLLMFFHPVYAVSDASGHFRIANFPASELVRITAWHPLFEPTETFVWLEPGHEHTVSLELTPKSRFVPAPPSSAIVVPHASP